MASRNQDSPSVLIAGAGPSGLILALSLVQNGVSVRIIEKTDSFHLGQRGAGIQPRTIELFQFLGYRETLMKECSYLLPMHMYKMPEGREVAKVVELTPHIEPTPDVPYRNAVLIGQSHNERLLREHLAQYGVKVELSTELVSFTQDNEGVDAIIVHHASSGQSSQEEVRVKYIVGAEGARSVVRKQLGLTFDGETNDVLRMFLADVYIKGLSMECWHQWGDNTTKMLMIRPTEEEGLFQVIVGGADVNTHALSASTEALYSCIRDITKNTELEFNGIVWSSEFRPNIRMANKFGKGRAFIIGDAAHVHSPTGGQGLNTGAQDGFNLAWKIAYVLKYNAPASLLETYTTERLPVVKDMLERTSQILQKTIDSKASDPDGGFIKRPTILHQLGVNYRWSTIVVDEQSNLEEGTTTPYGQENSTILRAGDRAPDSPGLTVVGGNDSKKTSLFEIFKPHRHTIILFGGNGKAIFQALHDAPAGSFYTVLVLSKGSIMTDELKALNTDLNVVDSDEYARTYYPPTTQGFETVVVRPDGVVGAIVKSEEGLKKYLRGVFGI